MIAPGRIVSIFKKKGGNGSIIKTADAIPATQLNASSHWFKDDSALADLGQSPQFLNS